MTLAITYIGAFLAGCVFSRAMTRPRPTRADLERTARQTVDRERWALRMARRRAARAMEETR